MLRIDRLDGRKHDRGGFESGSLPLDDYLRQRASQHHRDGIATTHVLVDDGVSSRILGFYTLAAAQVSLAELAPPDRKRLPRHPVPAARLARLAVARAEQGRGLGAMLLQDAVKRCLALRGELGVRVLLVDAKDERASGFYAAFGFRKVQAGASTLYLALGTP